MWSVTSIESSVVCHEYRILCCLLRVYSLVLSVTSIESCAVRDEFRNLMLSVASIEIFVLASIIFCRLWQV